MGLSKAFNNIINLTSGFTYKAHQPIDDRLVVDDYASLEAIIELNEYYEGMIVSVINDSDKSKNGAYVLTNTPYDNEENPSFRWIKLETDLNSNSDVQIILTGGSATG